MEYNRRNFISKIGVTTGTLALGSWGNELLAKALEDTVSGVAHLSAEECARNEDFWNQIHQAYTVSPLLLNLNNGGVSPQPKVVRETLTRYTELANEAPGHYMYQVIGKKREPIRKGLAGLAGCSAEEIAINRNASEALETVIFGLPLTKGDEVVLCKEDYPNMINAWKQREQREGIVLKWLSFDFPIMDKNKVVEAYNAAITDKTKLIHITHMINWDGQIMPVKEVVDVAHAKGVEVLVDAAHSFAQLDFKITDLGCDYLGTSLHKWLCAPFGTGMLYIKREKIKKVYPLLASDEPLSGNIRKFESLGTRSIPKEMAIGAAIEFHEMIGAKRKEARLRYLKNYWLNKAKTIPGITCESASGKEDSCAICLIALTGMNEHKLAKALMKKYGIYVVPIVKEKFRGIRVTPNTYTRLKDLDRFTDALKKIAN